MPSDKTKYGFQHQDLEPIIIHGKKLLNKEAVKKAQRDGKSKVETKSLSLKQIKNLPLLGKSKLGQMRILLAQKLLRVVSGRDDLSLSFGKKETFVLTSL